jgi:hypothetical protein
MTNLLFRKNRPSLRAGDWVEVRSAKEILAMLGPDGRLYRDRLPFMPEMLQYCGRRFKVSRVAHKTCDTATLIMGRRMRDTVFLEDLRCNGSAHGGCQARCLLFWKTQWLKPVEVSQSAASPTSPPPDIEAKCSERKLYDATTAVMANGEVRYFCQATEHWAATEPLRALAVSHFIEDLRTGNAKFKEIVKVVGLHLVWRLRCLKRGWRISLGLYDRIHRFVTGRPDPFRAGVIPEGAPTPGEKLDLQPGDWVEVKSHDEILKTVNTELQNRGLKYNAEMTPVCGQRFQVAQRVFRIIEEKSGRMITMKNPCITLEGVYCQALYTSYSLLCSRRVTPYFREIWLRRVSAHDSAQPNGSEPLRRK